MKKALSILLIVAAVFGFYGGAVNLKDVLACKDYWEVEGEKSTENLNKLEDGINQLKENEQAYLDGLDKVAQGEQDLAKGEADYAAGQKELAAGEADYAAAPAKLAAGEKDLATGKEMVAAGEKELNNAKMLLNGINSLHQGLTSWKAGYNKLDLAPALTASQGMIKEGVDALATNLEDNVNTKELGTALKNASEHSDSVNGLRGDAEDITKELDNVINTIKQINPPPEDPKDPAYANHPVVIANALKSYVNSFKTGYDNNGGSTLNDKLKDFADGMTEMATGIVESGTMVEALQKNGVKGKAALTLLETLKKDTIAPGVKISEIVSNSTNYQFMNNTVLPPTLGGTPQGLVTMVDSVLQEIKGSLEDNITDGNTKLKAGKKQVAAGEKELAKGYADYKAAPGKLAAGRAQLAAGAAKLAQGRLDLADGKAQLAQYEDGEQQVRDGLATLFATEANGGLESIASRLNNDDNFDNEDGHLMLDRGLTGVQEGRNYSDDSSVVITKELTTRAIGTGAGLGAALLALIGAILCFAKKYKGAGVFAALTAICGVAGIAVAKSAGTEFSGIAGSPLSATPYIAFAVLAGLGVIAAIANFAAKKA